MAITTTDRSQVLRRYPALAFLVVAGFLATMLPSALRLPLSGPTQSAELAPVPGEGEGQEGDLAELGLGSSDGLGAGSGTGGGVATTVAGGPSGVGANPRSKLCVGRPPRQTEDPFSPPCVAYFTGNNGGATARGVTKDEIVVVAHLGLSTSTRPEGVRDLAAPPAPEDDDTVRVVKAYGRYFNDRYQYYGRRLHLYGYYGPETRNDVIAIDNELRPFAFIKPEANAPEELSLEAAARRMISASYSAFPRATHRQFAPHLVTFLPDVEDQAALSSTYMCSKLAGRPARWAADRAMRGQPRVFGLFWQDHSTSPSEVAFRDALKAEVQRRCGLRFAAEVGSPMPGAGSAPSGYAAAVAQFRDAGVTTVVIAAGSGATNNLSIHAGSQGYLPEWFLSGGGGGDVGPEQNSSGRLANQATWEAAFGITSDPRRDHYQRQHWFRAFVEGCPGCPEPTQSSHRLGRAYDLLALLSYGMQAAGPRLTPESFDRGMHTIPQRGSADPYAPAAYFSPGNFSFIKDASEMWWDPQGEEPGWNRPGCYRLVRDGARARAGEWQGDDGVLFSQPAPCQVTNQRPTA